MVGLATFCVSGKDVTMSLASICLVQTAVCACVSLSELQLRVAKAQSIFIGTWPWQAVCTCISWCAYTWYFWVQFVSL